MYRIADLRRLSEAYMAATGTAATTLSRRISPTHNRIITNLMLGLDITGKYVELTSDFFDENWPAGVAWPLDKPRCPQRNAAE
jgi:hypothetical protein